MTSRWVRRGVAILANSAYALVPPILGLALAYVVIHRASVELWGRFVTLWILVQIAVHVIAWGNKEFLLRAFSGEPNRLTATWRSCLVTRLTLLLPIGLLAMVLLGSTSPLQACAVGAWTLLLSLHQSFDVLILYRRAFVPAVAVEAVAFGITVAALWVPGSRLSLDTLVVVFASAAACRVAMLAALFRGEVGIVGDAAARGGITFVGSYFERALPFLLLGFTGMLMSRTDLYCVAALLDRAQLGTYQVLTSFLLYLQSLSALMVMPFLKGLYRLPESALRSLSLRLPVVGIAVVVPGCAVIPLVMHRLYGLPVSPWLAAVGGLSILPSFAYLPLIYLAYRNGHQRYVVWVNLFGIATNLPLNLALLPALGLLGAVVASAAAQWLMLGAYAVRDRIAGWEPRGAVPHLP